jgi:hypothetical protein
VIRLSNKFELNKDFSVSKPTEFEKNGVTIALT